MSGQRIPHPAFNLSRRLKSAAGNRDKEQAPRAAPLVKYPGRQREESLAHEIERMHLFQAQLIQTSSDGIIANDQRGRIIIFNQGAETILGYRMEEVIGKIPVQKLFPPGGARFIKKGIYSPEHGGSGRLVHYETQVLSKTGELVPVELSASLIYEGDLEVATVGFFRDLRERRKLQDRLLQAERLAVLGRVAAHISHEIKNPLTIIGGFARQILKNSSGELQDRKKLQIILEEVRRLEDFLVEVGSFVKFAEPHPIQGDLNALLQETCLRLEPTLTENGIHLLLQPDPAIPGVKFDPHQLRQVILNIAKNSIEAMPQGGTLTISSGRQSDRVFVQICDTGIGISPETMGKIFQPFYCYSTKPKGSGLGLIISQKIMEAHQGELTIESEPHKGTKVNLYLKMNCPGSGSI